MSHSFDLPTDQIEYHGRKRRVMLDSVTHFAIPCPPQDLTVIVLSGKIT